MNGFLTLHKPCGPTSRDLVNAAVKLLGTRQIGHAGTLDPMASGVLVLAVGRATRLVEYVQRMKKTYRATIRLGATSDTDDREGVIAEQAIDAPPTPDELERALSSFRGEIMQTPPAYSAIRVAGKRAHKLARQGIDVDLKPRPVRVFDVRVLSYCFPHLELEIDCGAGVYIRSIARDLGRELGVGGMLADLVRTAIGPFDLIRALSLAGQTKESLLARLLPPESAVALLPQIGVTAAQAEKFQHGLALAISIENGAPGGDKELAVFDENRRFLGIGRWDEIAQCVRPIKTGFS